LFSAEAEESGAGPDLRLGFLVLGAVAPFPNQALARLNLVEALAMLGNKDAVAQEARLGLAYLDRATDNVFLMDEAGHFPPTVDEFSVAWERAGQRNKRYCELFRTNGSGLPIESNAK
jgi:hypothetical protein